MKKLIVVAMTMAVAVAANASQCCWGSVSGEWYNVNGEDLTSGEATIFFYLGEVTASSTAFDTTGGTFVKSSGFDWDNWGYGDVSSDALVDLAAITTTTAGQAYSLVLVDKSVNTLDGYEGNYIILNGTSTEGTIPGATVSKFADFTNAGAVAQDSWSTMSAAPEPTSGLLLLLGVAGLALKRRRA